MRGKMALFIPQLPKVDLGLDLPNTIRIRNVMPHDYRPLLAFLRSSTDRGSSRRRRGIGLPRGGRRLPLLLLPRVSILL